MANNETNQESSAIRTMLGRKHYSPSQATSGLGALNNRIELNGSNFNFEIKKARVIEVWTKQKVVLCQVGGSNHIKCPFTTLSHNTVSGLTEIYVPQIGDVVIIGVSPGTDIGIIICSTLERSYGDTPKFFSSEDITENVTKVGDAKTFMMEENVQDFQRAGSPLSDALPGEKYALNENLVGYIISKYFMSLQAGDLCALHFNYLDSLLEAIVHNLRVLSSGFFLESMCDYGRTNTELHLSAHLNDFVKEDEAERRANSFLRVFAGWLAAGTHFYTQSEKEGEEKPLSDIWLDDLGTIAISSISSCFFYKPNGIYVPKRLLRPDEWEKESDKEIEEDSARKPFQWASGASDPMAFGMQLRDFLAWTLAGEYQFGRYAGYEKDWEEVEPESGSQPPQIGKYGNDVEIELGGEREGETTTAKAGEAFCGVLPDGSVLLKDAWGSQVELRGGKIVVSGADEVEISSGKRVVMLSGGDVVIKSSDHTEIIAVNEDMRIRSGKSTYIDSKKGGVQITAPEQASLDVDGQGSDYRVGGVVLKSPSMNFIGERALFSLDSVFSIQGQESGDQPSFMAHTLQALFWTEGGGLTLKDNSGYVQMSNGNILNSGSLITEQHGIFKASLQVNEMLNVYDGPISTSGEVNKNVPQSDRFKPVDEYSHDQAHSQRFDGDKWDEMRKPFLSEVLEDIRFKHRTTAQYKTEDEKWFEKFWQRQYQDSLSTVDYDNDTDQDEENSFPGRNHISGSTKSFITYTEVNVAADGTPKKPDQQSDKGGEFGESTFGEQKLKKQ